MSPDRYRAEAESLLAKAREISPGVRLIAERVDTGGAAAPLGDLVASILGTEGGGEGLVIVLGALRATEPEGPLATLECAVTPNLIERGVDASKLMERVDRLGRNGSLGATYAGRESGGDAERANCVWGPGEASSLQAALGAVESLALAEIGIRKIDDAGSGR